MRVTIYYPNPTIIIIHYYHVTNTLFRAGECSLNLNALPKGCREEKKLKQKWYDIASNDPSTPKFNMFRLTQPLKFWWPFTMKEVEDDEDKKKGCCSRICGKICNKLTCGLCKKASEKVKSLKTKAAKKFKRGEENPEDQFDDDDVEQADWVYKVGHRNLNRQF